MPKPVCLLISPAPRARVESAPKGVARSQQAAKEGDGLLSRSREGLATPSSSSFFPLLPSIPHCADSSLPPFTEFLPRRTKGVGRNETAALRFAEFESSSPPTERVQAGPKEDDQQRARERGPHARESVGGVPDMAPWSQSQLQDGLASVKLTRRRS